MHSCPSTFRPCYDGRPEVLVSLRTRNVHTRQVICATRQCVVESPPEDAYHSMGETLRDNYAQQVHNSTPCSVKYDEEAQVQVKRIYV